MDRPSLAMVMLLVLATATNMVRAQFASVDTCTSASQSYNRPLAPSQHPCWSSGAVCCFQNTALDPTRPVGSIVSNATGQPLPSYIVFGIAPIVTHAILTSSAPPNQVLTGPINPCSNDPGCSGGIQYNPATGITCCSLNLGQAPGFPNTNIQGTCADPRNGCLPCAASLTPLAVGHDMIGSVAVTDYICVPVPPQPQQCNSHIDCQGQCGGAPGSCCCEFGANPRQCKAQPAPCACAAGGTPCGEVLGGLPGNQVPSGCAACCSDTAIPCNSGLCSDAGCLIDYYCLRNTNRAAVSQGRATLVGPAAPNDGYCLGNCRPDSPGGCTQCIPQCACFCSCFPGETQVHVNATSTVRIDALRTGDSVYCPTQGRIVRVVGVNKLERRGRPLWRLVQDALTIAAATDNGPTTTGPAELSITDGHILFGDAMDRRYAVAPDRHSEPIFNVSRDALRPMNDSVAVPLLRYDGTVVYARAARREDSGIVDDYLYSLTLEECHAHSADGYVVSDMFPDLVARPDATDIVYHLWRHLARTDPARIHRRERIEACRRAWEQSDD